MTLTYLCCLGTCLPCETLLALNMHTHTQQWKWLYLHVTPGLVIQRTQKLTALFLLLRCYDAPSLSSPVSTAPEGLPHVVVSFSSPLLTLSLRLFSFLTPPRILVCHSHHLQQQSLALFFYSLSPSSPVSHVTVVADRQFLTIEISPATLFMCVSFSLRVDS